MCSDLQPVKSRTRRKLLASSLGSAAYINGHLWSGSCTCPGQPALPGPRSGCRLLTNEIALSTPLTSAKPKRSISPVLIVLFVVSYGLMVLLITEQGRTIMNQRVMIQQLLGDSAELTHLKVQLQQRVQAQPQSKSQGNKQIPSIQVPPQAQSKNNSQARPMQEHPPKPASDAQDARRRVFSI